MKTFFAILILFALCSSFKSAAFNYSTNGKTELVELTNYQDSAYTLDTVFQGVMFYHKIVQCNGSDVVMLSFINTGSQDKTITWQEKLTVDNTMYYDANKTKTLVIHGGVTKQTDCSTTPNSQLVTPSLDYGTNMNAQISQFAFYSITVN